MWNLFACGEQIMRAADCKSLSESPEGVFRQSGNTPAEKLGYSVAGILDKELEQAEGRVDAQQQDALPAVQLLPGQSGDAQQGGVQVGTSVSSVMLAFENFVKTQSDAALRQVAGLYAYDNNEAGDKELTLRDDADEINKQLEAKLDERLSMAGIEVVEARINYLAYAPEIAAVMLRRQQAAAIISAREKIVEGAVSMVKMALDKLSREDVVELDDDKKAAMVSNLLVVLCGDDTAQPVVNTGTLNH